MKFRIYKLSGDLKFLDVEAESKEDAKKQIIAPDSAGWHTVSAGWILGSIIAEHKEEDRFMTFSEFKEKSGGNY